MSEPTASGAEDGSSSYRYSLAAYLCLAILTGFALLGKLPLLVRVVHLPAEVLTGVVLVWMCLPLLWKSALRWRKFLAPLMLLGVVISSMVIFPRMADLKKTGRGTDQPDCVIVAANGMAAGTWPYDHTRMWSRTPMSCGPGWVALQLPAVILMGYQCNLLVLWALALWLMRTQLQTRALASFLSLLGLAIVTWVAACDGTDFLPFGLIACGLMVALSKRSRYDMLWLLLLIFIAQFRFPMLILPVLLLPAWRLRQSISVSVIAFLYQICFLLWRPSLFVSDGPLHLFAKVLGARLLSGARWTAALEVTLVFTAMLAVAVAARKLVPSTWLAFYFLFVLAAGPAVFDLHEKYRLYHNIAFALGIWEGLNWLSGCLPLAVLYLLASTGEICFDRPCIET